MKLIHSLSHCRLGIGCVDILHVRNLLTEIGDGSKTRLQQLSAFSRYTASQVSGARIPMISKRLEWVHKSRVFQFNQRACFDETRNRRVHERSHFVIKSRGSGRDTIVNMQAASSTETVIGPRCATVPKGLRGYAGTKPNVGLNPNTPLNAAGIRIEPPPSVPRLRNPSRNAAATAAPPLDPPGVILGFHGLRVTPVRGESHTPFHPNSGVVVLPNSTAPASRSLWVAGASSSQLCDASIVREPLSVGQPFVSTRSLMVVGMPSMKLKGSFFSQRDSDCTADRRAASASTTQKAL